MLSQDFLILAFLTQVVALLSESCFLTLLRVLRKGLLVQQRKHLVLTQQQLDDALAVLLCELDLRALICLPLLLQVVCAG